MTVHCRGWGWETWQLLHPQGWLPQECQSAMEVWEGLWRVTELQSVLEVKEAGFLISKDWKANWQKRHWFLSRPLVSRQQQSDAACAGEGASLLTQEPDKLMPNYHRYRGKFLDIVKIHVNSEHVFQPVRKAHAYSPAILPLGKSDRRTGNSMLS